MSEKASTSTDQAYASRNEKEKVDQEETPELELVDGSARRQSAALNIVENPLKVSIYITPPN